MKKNRVIARKVAANLSLDARVELEARLTDGFAAEKAKIRPIPAGWTFEKYSNLSPWKKSLFDFLGSLEDKTILDIGCGYHPTPTYFARAGANKVVACDVSPKAMAFQQQMAKDAKVADRVKAVVCSVEQLPFPSEKFDLVHGESAIHHLRLPLAGPEIARVLKKGGKGGFKDPLGQNILLELARDYLPYGWKPAAKGTDRPLKYSDIEAFGRNFSRLKYQGMCLSSIVTTFLAGRGPSKPRQVTDRLDAWLLNEMPFLQRYCRYVVTCVEK